VSESTPTPRLWEIHHPYYCNEGNYYASGSSIYDVHSEYDSWHDFIADWGDTDPDLNLVFRWDWNRADPDDYDDGEELPPDRLLVFWVLQRKAILRSTECIVTEADEPAVREWLAERAKTIAAIWEPIALVYREDEQDGGTR
jgi:hypothetical protein